MNVTLTEEEWVVLAQAAQMGGNVMQMVIGIQARPIRPLLEKMDAQLRAQKESPKETGNGKMAFDSEALHQRDPERREDPVGPRGD